jgi:soluble lytic murein transglycosylase
MTKSFQRARLFAFGILVASGLCVFSSHARATRPTVRTAIAIRNIKLSMPVSIEDSLDKSQTGLAQESDINATILGQAKDYVEFRSAHSLEGRIRWLHKCEATRTQNENYFCRYEISRPSKTAALKKRLHKREVRLEYAENIRGGRYDRLAEAGYPDIVASVSRLGEPENIYPIADRILAREGAGKCVPSSVPTALAYKLEEKFPDPKAIDYAEKLYTRGAECGRDFPAAKASFRLGLMHVWKNQCGDVSKLMSQVEAVREASQFHSRAKYWRLQCATQIGNAGEVKAAKESLLREYPLSFHNLAANGDDLKAVAELIERPAPSIAYRSIVRPDLNAMIRAAEALLTVNAQALAAEIIDRNLSELKGLEPEVRLYSATLLHRSGATLTNFKLMSELFQDSPRMVSTTTMKMYFPLHYFDLIKPVEDQIDPLLVLSLIRQESAFNKQARSIVGARGLMQVMPTTARTIASVRPTALFDPKTNIKVGTKYLLKRLTQYDGDVELTLAAYNAGFGRVDQWLRRYPTANKVLFLDFIPFKETREYVATILRNYYWYVKLYETKPQDTDNTKLSAATPKVISIISANAGLAAAPARR